ncbi:MAG: hypothetical protein LBK91_06785 [Synergistaceae bacterium]|jgi:hypothetical protein|nr:hypothetical protein [Synergistaceae bacterium]
MSRRIVVLYESTITCQAQVGLDHPRKRTDFEFAYIVERLLASIMK